MAYQFRTAIGQNIYNQKYSHEGAYTWPQLSEQLVREVLGCPETMGYITQDDIQELTQYVTDMKFIPGGRYLYYAGRPLKAYNNCYLLKGEEDTREEWGSLLKRASDCLMTGGGIGIDYSVFRSEGTHLKRTGGKASGPIPLMHSVNETGRNVMQGGSRRSAIYASLNWKHGDATSFLQMKDWHSMRIGNQLADGGMPYTVWHAKQEDFNYHAPLDMTNVSLNYDDAWLFMKNRDKDATFLQNVKQALRTGEPGFSFNFGSKENETLRNACVTFNTPLLTDTGYHPIGTLVGAEVNMWNGHEFSVVTPFSTGINEVVRVHLTDGSHIDCTPYHKFITQGGAKRTADTLTPGTALEKWKMPVVSSSAFDMVGRSEAYSQGFYSGDGNTDYTYSYLYDTKYACMPSLIGTFYPDSVGRKRWVHGHMQCKSFVPINASLFYKLSWLAGILDSDGTVTRDVNGNGLQIGSIDKEFLLNIRLMLNTMGVSAKVVSGAAAGYRPLPDGMGGMANYYCQAGHRLLVGNTDTCHLLGLGLSCHRLVLHNSPPQRDARRFVRVKEVEWLGVEEETFCVSEPLRNNMTVNGVVTGNCTEVTSADDSDCCNLGSVNMSRISSIDEFRDVVSLASKFLACGTLCGDVPFEKVRAVRDKNRRLGLGLMGMHEWLLQRGYGYEVTPELHDWLWVYREYSKRGADELCDALHISRPVAYRAIAPTGTIGMIAGTTTGIEPLFAVAYKRRYLKGSHQWYYQYVIDGTAMALIEEYGLDPDKIDSAYKMSHEPEKRIKFQADVQDYVDMAISSTINLPEWGSTENNEDTVEDFASTLSRYAPRLRGFTVYPDGSRGGQPLTECTYAEAMAHGDKVYEDNDSCKGGVCGI